MRLACVNGYPGYGSNALMSNNFPNFLRIPLLDYFKENFGPNYPAFGEYTHGKTANQKVEVFQDVTT